MNISGDVAIARYIARRAGAFGIVRSKYRPGLVLLTGRDGVNDNAEDVDGMALVDQWVDYALAVSRTRCTYMRMTAIRATLDPVLECQTYLHGHTFTLADVAVFKSLGFPSQAKDANEVFRLLGGCESPTTRWIHMMRSHPAVREATQLAVGINNEEAVFEDGKPPLEPLVTGMSPLQGATPGNVVTRFPPEPSGYLHVGHAKAVLMNEYYAKRYKGRLIVRFDDTNPTSEKQEFQSSIIEDLLLLGVSTNFITFSSDYFQTVQRYAEFMITNGLAFMDDTPKEEMQKERRENKDSKYRDNQSLDDCRKYFDLMCSGHEDSAKWCLRAKINMQSVNGTMRDPVIYRQNITPHHRTGDKFKAYPTYDLACPIIDSIEGVTHALRTTEYNDRDEQYAWFQRTLGLRRVRIHSFARMNFMATVLSKRKLAWFVDNGHVTGWDDARVPTIRGVVRRGVNITALRNFIYSQGVSRRIVNMEWNKFWAVNKKEIDTLAKRYMAIDKCANVKFTVTNAPEEHDNCYVSTDFHPKNPNLGKRVVRISKNILLEKVDTEGIVVGEEIVLMRWGVVKVTKVSDNGHEGEFIPNGNVKAAKRKLSWIADVKDNITVLLTEFDNLISKDKLEDEDDFQDHINPNTLATSEVVGDAGLQLLQKNEIIQIERRGYYRVDRCYMDREKGLILFMIPDGKTKPMSGLTGKLAHC